MWKYSNYKKQLYTVCVFYLKISSYKILTYNLYKNYKKYFKVNKTK